VKVRLERRDLFDNWDLSERFDAVVLILPTVPGLVRRTKICAKVRIAGREPDLFALAIERALCMAGPAPLGLIVPDVIRMQPEYAPLREILSDPWKVAIIERLPFGLFRRQRFSPIYCSGSVEGRSVVGPGVGLP